MGEREARTAAGGTSDVLIAKASAAKRESRGVVFRPAFEPATARDRVELLRDVAALANSGGGVIVVGVDERGKPTGWDPSGLLATDPVELRAAFGRYVGETADGFDVCRATRSGADVAAVVVRARTGSPLVFERPGAYENGDGEQHAFERGTIYFRHGRHSEPASAADVRRFTTRELQRQRREWNRNVRKVAAAPAGAHVVVIKPKAVPEPDVVNVRVVDDADAPAFARADFDVTHPYRQTEVVKVFNDRVGDRVVSAYDLQCVRRIHSVDDNPRFFHVPKFGSPQYSETFVSWLVDRYRADPDFFAHAKQRVHELRARRSNAAGAGRDAS